MTLDLFTFITKYSSGYAEYLKYTGSKNLSGKHKVNWKCVESLNADRLPEGYKVVCKAGGEGEHSSMKHAIAMEEALSYIESEYVLFIDADVALLYKGWDDVIINKLQKYDCFGGSYVRGKSKFLRNRYKDFPVVNLFAFRSDILKKVELDFKPFIINKKGNKLFNIKVKKEHEKIFGINEGKKLACDIGWKLPLIFEKNNLTYDFMVCYLTTHKYSKLPFTSGENKKISLKKGRGMEEWHYEGKLFATHKKFSRYCDIDDGLGKAWRDRVDLYLSGRDSNDKEE